MHGCSAVPVAAINVLADGISDPRDGVVGFTDARWVEALVRVDVCPYQDTSSLLRRHLRVHGTPLDPKIHGGSWAKPGSTVDLGVSRVP